MENRTNIQIEHDTLSELRELKLVKQETYNELLKRLIEQYNDVKLEPSLN